MVIQNLEDLGLAFRDGLRELASAATLKPIILIAHSLGGLIVKQALISLSRSENEDDQKLIQMVYGIVFFGVPHHGMDIGSLIPMVGNGPNRFLLESIGNINSQVLSEQHRQFHNALGGKGESEVVCFYETLLSPTAERVGGMWRRTGPPAFLMTRLSATHCRPWEKGEEHVSPVCRTHSEMVKFVPEDHEYDKVRGRIRGLVRRALAAKRSLLRPELSQPSQDCLKSLAFREMDNRFNDIEAAEEGTCKWLLLHETERIAIEPCSGKSTLLKCALDNGGGVPSTGDGSLILSFLFHGRGDKLQKTPLGLFRSLFYQLLKQLPNALQDLVDTFEQKSKELGEPGEKWQWHPEELWRFFESSLPKVLKTRSVSLFVDALDENGKKNAVDLVRKFKYLLKRLPSTGLNQVRICFTCRHYPILDLDGVFEICLERENREDIGTYVQGQLSAFQARTASTIPTLIADRADGVFLWAHLVVKQVLDLDLKGETLATIQDKIHSVPRKLYKLYRKLIRNMGSASLKLIQWICFATRPLLVDELRWAMFIDVDCPHRSLQACQNSKYYEPDSDRFKTRIQTLSCGLAEVTPSSHAQFIHQSVKDFFVEKSLETPDSSSTSTDLTIGIAHSRLSRICIRYLAMEEFGRSTTRERDAIISEFPFLTYATTSWLAHAQQSEAKEISQVPLLDVLGWPSESQPSDDIVRRWTHLYQRIDSNSENCPPKGTTLLHIASRCGLMSMLSAYLDRLDDPTAKIDPKDEYKRTPLLYAAERGHTAAVEVLLEKGADPDSKDENNRTPLLYTAERGHITAVKMLLEKGANPDSKDVQSRTPLLYAAARGHEAVVEVLLGKANINTRDEIGATSLHWAVWKGHEVVILRLLKSAADIEVKDEGGGTPLAWAIERGFENSIRMLLAKGAEMNYWYKLTPLMLAVEKGNETAITQLLNKGAMPDSVDERGRSPLSLAKDEGNETIIKLLEPYRKSS
ncbi:hypothetical protein RRF57_012969 [Xylaria bambusicola]|uniref:DUF676 domain-containing protein n=1 Tax=Xylaria bambusicola TaxID=326684 RepID=A0AAN7UW52_9PEZI